MRMTEKEYADLLAQRKAENLARTRSTKAYNYAKGVQKKTAQEPALLGRPKLSFSFVVPGIPVPKARPRLGKGGHVYTPTKTVEAEAAIRSCAEIAGVKVITGALRMAVEFQMGPANDRAYPALRPDADNLAKTVLDALNRVAYRDDAQIVELVVVKSWGEPKTLIDIHEL